MDSAIGMFIVISAIVIVVILIMRFVGAWMLRINELIDNQHAIIKILKEIKDKP